MLELSLKFDHPELPVVQCLVDDAQVEALLRPLLPLTCCWTLSGDELQFALDLPLSLTEENLDRLARGQLGYRPDLSCLALGLTGPVQTGELCWFGAARPVGGLHSQPLPATVFTAHRTGQVKFSLGGHPS